LFNSKSIKVYQVSGGNQLDAAKWEVFKGAPTVADGKLTLNGGAARAEIQSKRSFLYGAVTIALESANFKPQSGDTDSSFGVEIFTGANGGCHYSAVLKANGHLGLLRPQPDAANNCTGDPLNQEHLRIPNWDAIRAGGRVVMMLIWTPGGVTLRVSDGNVGNSVVMSASDGKAVPNVAMRVRLNADVNEVYRVDTVRWADPPPAIKANEFVTRRVSKLTIANREFRFAGADTYYLQPEIAYGNAAGVGEALDKMLGLGMTVARTIGFNDHPYQNNNPRCGGLSSEVAGNDPAAIQLRPGVFCEPNLAALDQAVAEAKARNIRLIVYLTNNFTAYGGKRRYVQWRMGPESNPTEEQLGMFYTDATIREWFRNYLTMLLNRRNTITGALYKDEAAIVAWELGNELRNKTSVASERARRADELLAWTREMAGHIKSIDRNHLVADGGEGFDDVPTNYPGLSNQYAVRGDESCSYSRLAREPLIDLLSYHLYPASWGLNDASDVEIWIRAHEQIARAAGKAAYLGEFGKRPGGDPPNCDTAPGRAFDAARAQLYEQWLKWAVEEYCTAGQLVWQLAYDARPDCDGFAVYVPRDAQTAAALWRYEASSAAPPLAAVNAASYSTAMLAPDSIAGLFGVEMARATQIAASLPLPTALAGSQVVVRDALGVARPAPLFFVSPTQINLLVPKDTATGVATLQSRLDDGFVSCGLVTITNVAPGLFTANASGSGVAAGQALRVKPNGMQIYESIARFDPAQNQFTPIPIDLGPAGEQVYLILYGTGIRYHSGLSNVTVTIGGVAVGALYAGLVAGLEGLDQVNVLLSRSLIGRGEVDVVLTVDGKMANPVRVNIR
jgi:mannan endo-1,4-beta-mannosidase